MGPTPSIPSVPPHLISLNGDAGYGQAAWAFSQALELEPSDGMGLSSLLTARRSLCQWDGLEDLQHQVVHKLQDDLK